MPIAQIQKNQTSKPSESWFVYQNQTTNPPEPSKNPELRTHELGSTQHYPKDWAYSLEINITSTNGKIKS